MSDEILQPAHQEPEPESPDLREGSSYTVNARCDNCGMRGSVEVPRGVPLYAHLCPRCSLKGLLLA